MGHWTQEEATLIKVLDRNFRVREPILIHLGMTNENPWYHEVSQPLQQETMAQVHV